MGVVEVKIPNQSDRSEPPPALGKDWPDKQVVTRCLRELHYVGTHNPELFKAIIRESWRDHPEEMRTLMLKLDSASFTAQTGKERIWPL